VSLEPTEELTDAPFRKGDAGIGRAVVQVDATSASRVYSKGNVTVAYVALALV